MARVKTTSALVVLVLACGCAARSSPTSRQVAGAVSESSVRSHMEFLAADALNGRGSGTRDEWIAATYVASQLRRWGLEPLGDDGGYVQTIEVERLELVAPPVLSVGRLRLLHGKEITVAAMSAAKVTGTLVRYQKDVPIAGGSAVLLPEVTREITETLGPAALLLTRPN